MGEKSTILEIIRQYYLSCNEIVRTKLNFIIFSYKMKNIFDNYEQMNEILKEEIDKYLKNVYIEMKVLNYILKNERKLYISDIYNTLDSFDENYEKRFMFIENVFENLQTAIAMNLDYKFYIPRNRPIYLNDDNYQKYLTSLKGFNIDRIKRFLIFEDVYRINELDSTLKNAKILNVEAKENLDMFGIFENKMVLPKVLDQTSSLVNIHELVHQALLNRKDEIQDDDIIYGEDLPIFYELLFIKFNDFIEGYVHSTDLALELLENYKDEKFEEQIIKLRKIKNTKR